MVASVRHRALVAGRRPACPQLRALVEPPSRDDIAEWELDIATIKSREPDQAWAAYGMMLERERDIAEPVVYGRYFAGPPAVLQYWYLYVYNDAPNKHEGDWEMVQLVHEGRPGRRARAGPGGLLRARRRLLARLGRRREAGRPARRLRRARLARRLLRPRAQRPSHELSDPRTKAFRSPIDALWNRLVLAFQNTATS